jgi:hypothetical protein
MRSCPMARKDISLELEFDAFSRRHIRHYLHLYVNEIWCGLVSHPRLLLASHGLVSVTLMISN